MPYLDDTLFDMRRPLSVSPVVSTPVILDNFVAR